MLETHLSRDGRTLSTPYQLVGGSFIQNLPARPSTEQPTWTDFPATVPSILHPYKLLRATHDDNNGHLNFTGVIQDGVLQALVLPQKADLKYGHNNGQITLTGVLHDRVFQRVVLP